MELINWRELYEANRAVIEGREPMAVGSVADPPAAVRADAHPLRVPSAHPLRVPSGHPLRALSAPALRAPSGHSRALAAPSVRPPGELVALAHADGRRVRPVYVYAPPDLDPAVPAPLVVMLHGCTQTAGSFSAATAMNRTADRHGFVVAYPEQSREENASCCWNWFSTSHQARGGGEPASIAGAARMVAEESDRWAVDPARVFVAGLSAGGAMAAVMAATHPDVFAAVAIHSGLAYGSARTLPAATQAMRRGAPDPEALGAAAFAAMGNAARVMPTLVVHGTADGVVAPVNAEHAVRQWMATNRRASGGIYDPDFARPDATVREDGAGGLPSTRRTWLDARGRVVQEQIEVAGLGHAWSGGTPGGSYSDPRGPSASDAIHAFFAAVSA